jgi:hypothetical protein
MARRVEVELVLDRLVAARLSTVLVALNPCDVTLSYRKMRLPSGS